MSQVDEGLIHAWLDGQVTPDEAARIEALVATDAAWGAAAAEARGLIAGASRILGALDSVPSARPAGTVAGGNGGRSTVRTAPRSWARAPWLRAAAAIVVVVGVGVLAWPRVAESPVPDAKEKDDRPGAVRMDAAPVVAQPPAEAGRPPAQKPASRPEPTAQELASSAKARASADERRVGFRAPAVTMGPVGNTAGAPGADAGAARRDTASISSQRGAAAQAAAEKKETVAQVAKSSVSGAGATASGAGGGRGGRSGAQGFAASPLAAADLAKALERQRIDPRLSGCWLPLDSTMAGVANELKDRDLFVLRFIEPVLTDVLAAPPATAPVPPAARPAPPVARIQNASPSAMNDSTFITEWIGANGRTRLTFTVRGDTLRGASRVSAGDIAYPMVPFRAVRVTCPR